MGITGRRVRNGLHSPKRRKHARERVNITREKLRSPLSRQTTQVAAKFVNHTIERLERNKFTLVATP
jgi:hypothetical protein